jgi:hypothetical protein
LGALFSFSLFSTGFGCFHRARGTAVKVPLRSDRLNTTSPGSVFFGSNLRSCASGACCHPMLAPCGHLPPIVCALETPPNLLVLLLFDSVLCTLRCLLSTLSSELCALCSAPFHLYLPLLEQEQAKQPRWSQTSSNSGSRGETRAFCFKYSRAFLNFSHFLTVLLAHFCSSGTQPLYRPGARGHGRPRPSAACGGSQVAGRLGFGASSPGGYGHGVR